MRSVDSFNFNGKKALIRVDFNVPIDNNIVTDSSRILAAKNTIEKVCNDGGSCILMSHLGRPKSFFLTGCDWRGCYKKILRTQARRSFAA